jgi:hypothetical protein
MARLVAAWLTENVLALYGAITGTAALLISYSNYRHTVGKERIKLAVSHTSHPHAASNISRIQSTEGEDWDRPNLVEVHIVTIRNLGSIPAPLEDVGVVTSKGEKKHSLIPSNSRNPMMLGRVSDAEQSSLEPRSTKSFSVYLTRDEPPFVVTQAYAVDQTGKVWTSKR